MPTLRRITLLTIILTALSANPVSAGIEARASVDKDGLNGYYLAIGEHYGTTQKEVVAVREKSIPDEDLPVVFCLAKAAGTAPSTIVKLRLGGLPWMDITLRLGLTAGVYYVAFDRDPGPPYGKAWGHFKNHPRDGWGQIRLADVDIINLANLKFVSEYYSCSPTEVIKMRKTGDNCIAVWKAVKDRSHAGKSSQLAADDERAKPARGNTKKK